MAVTNGVMTLAARSLAREQEVVVVDRARVADLASIATELLSKAA